MLGSRQQYPWFVIDLSTISCALNSSSALLSVTSDILNLEPPKLMTKIVLRIFT